MIPDLDTRPYFVVANSLMNWKRMKIFLWGLSEHFASIGVSFCAVSALTEEGIPELVEHLSPRANPWAGEVRLYALDNAEDIEHLSDKKQDPDRLTPRGGYRVLHHRL